MAITNELVKFLYGATGTPSTKAGEISFHSGNKAIYVGDGSTANLVTSHVKDASFVDGILTIEFVDNSSSISLNFNDVASAGEVTSLLSSLRDDINDVSTKLVNLTENAATKEELEDHTEDTSIHITAQERTDWNAAKSAIDAFLNENAVSEGVVDTLKEIQAYITSDASAADKLVKDLSDVSTRAEKGISDASAAQAAADAAQADVDTLEGTVTTLSGSFDTHSKDTTVHITAAERTAWNDAEGNAKAYADGLASNYDKAGDASKAEAAAKAYADAIKVNGQVQSSQEITLTGDNIKVGGSGYGNDSSISTVIDQLDDRISTVAETAGVKEVKVAEEDKKYADVTAANNVVTLNIKTQNVSAADASTTGLADAYETKQYVDNTVKGFLTWGSLQ